MDGPRLLAIEVETLFTLDGAGLLARVNEPGGGPAPRFLWGATAGGGRWWRRADLPAGLAEEAARVLTATGADPLTPAPAETMAEVGRLLAQHAPVTAVWQGPSFGFPDAFPDRAGAVLLSPADGQAVARWLPDWVDDVTWRQPVAVALVEGAAVAICAAARRGPAALEAGVESHPRWRRRGYAAAVTACWAAAVRAEGRIPFYSTSWDNTASQAVAAHLGLRQLANLLHVT